MNASQHPITAGGVPVYGMWFDPGYGYHVDQTKNVATGNEPESIYAVFSGKHFNGGCCFDCTFGSAHANSRQTHTPTPNPKRRTNPNQTDGNSETNNRDDGDGSMEALYFGNAHWRGNTGLGLGPWVGADLEQGMYYGGGLNQTVKNMQSQPLTSDFVTAYLRGATDGFMLKGGDATQGTLTTMYDGPRPFVTPDGNNTQRRNYQPAKKQGAIILATGGVRLLGAQPPKHQRAPKS